jgi:hypothetical protein
MVINQAQCQSVYIELITTLIQYSGYLITTLILHTKIQKTLDYGHSRGLIRWVITC